MDYASHWCAGCLVTTEGKTSNDGGRRQQQTREERERERRQLTYPRSAQRTKCLTLDDSHGSTRHKGRRKKMKYKTFPKRQANPHVNAQRRTREPKDNRREREVAGLTQGRLFMGSIQKDASSSRTSELKPICKGIPHWAATIQRRHPRCSGHSRVSIGSEGERGELGRGYMRPCMRILIV